MNYLIFGPWTGEFGYELSYWIGECRAIREYYPNHTAIASSFFGRKFLYDFCDIFLPHTPESIQQGNNICMCYGHGILPNPKISEFQKNDTVNILPGSIFKGLTLGGAHGHQQIKESVEFQKPKKLMAGLESLALIKSLINNRPLISIYCRNLPSGNFKYRWSEEKWVSLIKRLIELGYSVVSLLIGYNQKDIFLDKYETENFINFNKIFGICENMVELQIAFLNMSKYLITTPCGATMLGYLSETPMVFMVCEENDPTSHRNAFDIWRKKYSSMVDYIEAKNTIQEITVDECLSRMKL